VTPRMRRGTAVALASMLVLAACGGSEPELARDPAPVSEPPQEVDTDELALPMSLEPLQVLDPHWQTRPQHADGIFLGAGQQQEGVLTFTAVDQEGEARWSAERPPSCTGFALTTDNDGRALAVLTDATSSEAALVDTTASAYDLATGEPVWGPVDVPGPHQGPGLVFGAPPEEYMGENGPSVALDPDTGAVSASEEDLQGGRIVGEYEGTVLIAGDEALLARDDDGEERWQVGYHEHDWSAEHIRPAAGPPPVPGMALVEVGQGAGALIDLEEGDVVSDTVQDAAEDPATGTRVILDDEGLHALDHDGQSLWTTTVAPETSIAALGGVFLYLREGEAVRVHNVLTGEIAEAYDPQAEGRIVVPAQVTATGAAVLAGEGNYLLAALEHAYEDGT